MPASPSCNSTSTANSPPNKWGTPHGIDLDLVLVWGAWVVVRPMLGGDSWLAFDTEGGVVGIPLR